MKFLVSIDRDEDGVWVVECPSIPGGMAQGMTRDEALANVREAFDFDLTFEPSGGCRLRSKHVRSR